MDHPDWSRLKLVLKPHFDASGAAFSLSAVLALQDPNVAAGSTLFTFSQNKGRDDSPINKYKEADMTALDTNGALAIRLSQTSGKPAEVIAARESVGDVRLKLNVMPAGGDDVHAGDGMTALRKDQGGLVGVGRWFLPQPSGPETQYCNIVEWDLAGAPEGTRAVWSFGEGPEPVVKNGPASVLLDSVYMVGPIQSHPQGHTAKHDSEESGSCGTYWFGELPPNLDAMKDFTSNMFPRMSVHFRDTEGAYSLFLRKVTTGLGSLTCMASSLISYDEDTKSESDWDLVRLLNHHMVRSWVGLDPEDDGFENDWFSKGWAQLYSVFLPFRFGQRSPDYFKGTMNAFCTAYYTNPQMGISLQDTKTIASDWHARQIPYMRGCIYALKMDFYTRRASKAHNAGVLRPIDEILADISVRRRRGEKVQSRDWLQYLGDWLGTEASEKHFQDFLNGSGAVMDLRELKDSFGSSHEPVAVQQEIFDLGMDQRSFETKVVSGLVQGSRAQFAGLENGDRILWHSRLGACVTNFDKKIQLVIEREREKLQLEYWPRSWTKAQSWQVVRIAGD